jgi:hypothetical protein
MSTGPREHGMPKHELAQQTDDNARLRRAIARYDANSSARPAGGLDALMTSARSPRPPA